MAELWFYHLERGELERALPPLLEKCLQRGWRALVRAGEAAAERAGLSLQIKRGEDPE